LSRFLLTGMAERLLVLSFITARWISTRRLSRIFPRVVLSPTKFIFYRDNPLRDGREAVAGAWIDNSVDNRGKKFSRHSSLVLSLSLSLSSSDEISPSRHTTLLTTSVAMGGNTTAKLETSRCVRACEIYEKRRYMRFALQNETNQGIVSQLYLKRIRRIRSKRAHADFRNELVHFVNKYFLASPH